MTHGESVANMDDEEIILFKRVINGLSPARLQVLVIATQKPVL